MGTRYNTGYAEGSVKNSNRARMQNLLARLWRMYGLRSSVGARVLLDSGSAPSARAAETYQNLRRESSERLARLWRFVARPATAALSFPRLAWLNFPFLPALVLRAIGVRSASGERANQAAPSMRAA
jgi:hypothetical protein